MNAEALEKGAIMSQNGTGALSPEAGAAKPETTADDTTTGEADQPNGAVKAPSEADVTTDVRERSSEAEDAGNASKPGGAWRLSVSVSLRGLLVAALVTVAVAAAATFGWLYFDARQQLAAQAHSAANNARAEKISLDYATAAAAMNFQDLNGWKSKLVAGTSPELKEKLTKAADSMEQILVPLQWTSTAQPLAAKVRSETAGIYVVDCFVGVQTKTVQAPDPLQSTATYSLTLDSNKNWQITDVGGISAVVGQR
ncbi:hypothetical protein [Mycobacterium sp. Marseille-P9652]|uniref:hypothetical protein n=1 Tax=Mycobacterium sp. Marseille-P9652 TaxID=2654950 RepID=UPI0012E73500|nr:hypothetical protein [Mycobacterium sp. Marseille-P9652]